MKFAIMISSIRRAAWNTFRAGGLEHVQVVLARLGLDVRALAGQPARRRVHPLAPLLEHLRHRVLSEPVDLQVRVPGPQFARDGQVPAHVTQADR
jgi:hypothetical protein